MPALEKLYSDCYGVVKIRKGKIAQVYYDTIAHDEETAWAAHLRHTKYFESEYKAIKMRLLINIE